MDVIYIFACLMQLDCVLTHTPEGIFEKKRKIYHTMIYLNFKAAWERP